MELPMAPYDKDIMFAHYERYNQEVMDYFKERPNDLLVIDVSEKVANRKFVDFLGMDFSSNDFPWGKT